MQHKKIFERMISLLVAKIIICILSFVSFVVAHSIYEKNHSDRTRLSDALAIIGGILGVVFCVLLIVTNCNWLIIPKILLFITICIEIVTFDEFISRPNIPWRISVSVTIIAFIVCGTMYISNMESCETPDISETKTTVICAKDNSTTTGEFSGGIIYVHGSISEENIYKYYYELENGGIKQGSIPVDDTTIFFIESGEKAYLKTIETTNYLLDYNKKPVKRCFETTETTYELYVPKGSVTNVYVFDAE